MNKDFSFMCEMQAEFFSLANERFKCSSSFLIAKFMNSEIAKDLDNIDDAYNFVSPNNLVYKMSYEYPSLKKEGKNKYPNQVIYWIGYAYRAWCLLSKRNSYKIYKIIGADEMVSLYNAFHTFSIEYCVERFEEIAIERNGAPKTDYQIFKEVMQERRLIK